MQKLEDEFAKDLAKLRYRTRVSIWKYIKDDVGGRKELAEGELKGPTTETNYENVVSQNPKINHKIAEGFAKQVQCNPTLVNFKLLHYRLSPKSWEQLGMGLGLSSNLRNFSC